MLKVKNKRQSNVRYKCLLAFYVSVTLNLFRLCFVEAIGFGELFN